MAQPKRSGILVGTAGVYYVASQLAARGFHAAPTFGNAPHVDILVGLPDGARTASIQGKTSWQALRHRGRDKDKKPHHYEWDIGRRSAQLNKWDLFFALVDLKKNSEHKPDVFIVPSEAVHGAFERSLASGNLKRVRWYPRLEQIEPYRNSWESLTEYLERDRDPA